MSSVPPGPASTPQSEQQGHYTPITKQLWMDRLAKAARHQGDRVEAPVSHKPPEVTRITYPFSGDPAMRGLYRNPWGFMRIGCIVEDLDSLAGSVAFQHCSRPGSPPPLLVTACVDEIRLTAPISVDRDAVVEGKVVWTGKTSLDIQMQLLQKDDDAGGGAAAAKRKISALFSFVHLDPVSKKSSQVIQLLPQTEEDRLMAKARQELADARKAARMGGAPQGSSAVHPSALQWAAPLLKAARTLKDLPALASGGDTSVSAGGGGGGVPIPASSLENTFVTQPQHQNTRGRVFGGFLMRRAYELAFATTYMFAGARPVFVMVDEVSFKKPIDVGDLLRLKSRVLHTVATRNPGEALLFVEVEASVAKVEALDISSSNTFIFVFSAQNSARPVKRVLPTTEEEAMRAYECHLAAAGILDP